MRRTVMIGMLAALASLAGRTAFAAVPNDPLWTEQWGMQRVGVSSAWSASTGAGIKVAVIDTGVDTHVDLASKLVLGKSFVPGEPSWADGVGHGTMVAGIIGAVTNNGIGVAGAAPGAQIMPLRIFNSQGRITSDTAIDDAVKYAVDNGVSVINMSFGAKDLVCVVEKCAGPAGPIALVPGLDDSISYAFAHGVLVVVAAGNESAQFCDHPAFDPLALCVGMSNAGEGLDPRSNHGVRMDLVAPGVGIVSTFWDRSNPGSHSVYGVGDGTSFAAPLVAGTGALLMAMGATNVQAMRIIECTAVDLGDRGYDMTFGWGRLDAAAAVARFAAASKLPAGGVSAAAC